MNPTHDDLHRLETRVDGRLQSERNERIQADSDMEARLMHTLQNLHSENRGWMERLETKLDQLIEMRGWVRGWKGAVGWVVATGLAIYAAVRR